MSDVWAGVRVRRMGGGDLDRVLEIADGLGDAPHWPVSAYVAAMDPEHSPRRIALVAEAVLAGESVVFLGSERGQTMEEDPDREAVIEGCAAWARQAAKKGPVSDGIPEKRISGAKAHTDLIGFVPGVNPRPTSGTILGFAVASVVAPEAELETIAVVPGRQRRGVGALLLRALAEALRKERVTELMLEVRAGNGAAIGFYRALGFEETGRRAVYYADPEEDAVLMRLGLG